VSRPRRAPCLVRFLVAAPYHIVPHAAPPPPPLAPARRRVAACEPTAPRAVPCAFPRRRAISHRPSRCPSSASPRPRSAPRRSWWVDRAARRASYVSSSPRRIASPLTLPLLRLPSPPLGAALQPVSRPRRAPCLVRFLVAAPHHIAPHAAPPPPPLAPARRRVAAGESTAPRAAPRAFPRRRAASHRRSRCPSSASPRPRSAPRCSWWVDRAARRALCVSSSPRHIASPLTLPLLRLPSPPLGAALQPVSRPRRAPCLVLFLVAAPYRIAPHAAPPPHRSVWPSLPLPWTPLSSLLWPSSLQRF